MTWAEQRATDGGTLQARVEYSYDAFGNRLKRVQKNGSLAVTSDERYAYDGWDTAKNAPRGSENFDAYADLSSANAVTMRRVYGAGFDEPVARVASVGTTAWYLTDRQGSVRRVLDNSGTVTGSRDFSAFGAIMLSSGAGLDRYAYTAREWDGTLNLQYTRARMYDPAVGRFLREDPLGLSAGDENLFRYAGNAHTLTSDPSGLDGKEYNPNAQHWHHQYPKQVFENLGIKGLDIHAKENGLMIFAKDHIGEGGLHPRGWNPDWQI